MPASQPGILLSDNKENNGETDIWEESDEEKTKKYSDFEPESDEDHNCYKPVSEAWEKRKKKLIDYFGHDHSKITWEKVRNRKVRMKRRYFKGKIEEIEEFEFYIRIATTPAQKMFYLLQLIKDQTEVNVCEHMPVVMWKRCLHNGLLVLDILERYRNIVFDSSQKSSEDTKKGADYKGKIRIHYWNMIGMYSAISVEFHVAMLSIKPKTKLYDQMLRCEHMLFVFTQNVLAYFKRRNDSKGAAKAALGLVELVYYKTQLAYVKMQNEHSDCLDYASSEEDWPIEPLVVIPKCIPRQATFPMNSTTLISELLPLILKHGDKEAKTYATLFEIHHHSIIDNFHVSQELMLNSKLEDKVDSMDIATRRHFYRAITQLGLCAFRTRNIEESMKYLSKLYAGGGEYALGQASSQKPRKLFTLLEEIYERRKVAQYHLRISIKLVDFVRVVCGVVLRCRTDMGVHIPDDKWKKLKRLLGAKLLEATADMAGAPSHIDIDSYVMAARVCLGRDDFAVM